MERASKRCPLDRLGSLPEDLRIKILSLLPTTPDVVKMNMVSRIWRSMCSSLQTLVFDEDQFPNTSRKLERFIACIEQTLSYHVDSDIKMLCIKFCRPYDFHGVINAWISFAVEHNVEILDMTGSINLRERLPSCLFTSGSLKYLRLALMFGALRLPGSVFLPNLREMTLSQVIFLDEPLLQLQLFAGCPMLERLVISRCTVGLLKCFTISAPKLSQLQIFRCRGIQMCELVVQTPSLQSFSYDDALARNYHFGNNICISMADINLRDDSYVWRRSGDALIVSLLSLLQGLQHVRSLSTNLFFAQVISKDYDQLSSLSLFHNLQHLDVLVWPTREHLKMILMLVGKMSYLKVLHITFIGEGLLPEMLQTGQEIDASIFAVDLSNLMQIQIFNFEGLEWQKWMLKHLLENATSLNEMRVEVRTVLVEDGQLSLTTAMNFLEIAEKPLCYEFSLRGHWIIYYGKHYLHWRC